MRRLCDAPKIRETRTWNGIALRDFCVKNHLYTAGDNEEYTELLEFVDKNSPTPNNVWRVALDILDHSGRVYGVEDVEGMMQAVMNSVVEFEYQI